MEESTEPFVITIGRQTGSGGQQIGKILAQRLGIAYYDKAILSQAAEGSEVARKVLERSEGRRNILRQFIGAVQPFVGGGDFYASQLSDESLFEVQKGVITKLANEHSSIFVGRMADSILANHPRCVRIFIAANMEDRTRRIMDERKVDFKTAVRIIEETDEERAGYYNFHAETSWGNAESYDLCINVSTLGFHKTIDFIITYATAKLGIKTPSPDTTPCPEIF